LAENGSQDDDILFVDLSVAQRMVDKPDSISLVEVAALCTACPIGEMVRQISEVLPQARVTALRQAVTLRMQTAGQMRRFAVAISAVVMAIGTLVVLTTSLGAVTERRREIGLFRAMGFRQRHIEQVILGEASVVSLLGGVLGWVLGMVMAVVLAPSVADISQPVRWNTWLAVGAAGGALLIGLAGSLYPATRAARLDPTIALRSL
jgi:putative ABC transport system permease protein